MTDSTIDENAGDGLEIGPSVEDLFGPLEEPREEPVSETVDPVPPETELSALERRVDEIGDRTADDVFEQFRSEADGEYDVDGVLADESPEEIIACADDPDDTTDVLGDEDGLDDLLLTERRVDSEFLWVDTDVSEDDADVSSGDASTVEAVSSVAEEVDDGDRADGVDEVDDTTADEGDDAEPAKSNADDGSSGFFGWLRATLGGIF